MFALPREWREPGEGSFRNRFEVGPAYERDCDCGRDGCGCGRDGRGCEACGVNDYGRGHRDRDGRVLYAYYSLWVYRAFRLGVPEAATLTLEVSVR